MLSGDVTKHGAVDDKRARAQLAHKRSLASVRVSAIMTAEGCGVRRAKAAVFPLAFERLLVRVTALNVHCHVRLSTEPARPDATARKGTDEFVDGRR